jgi:hypothetical protein
MRVSTEASLTVAGGAPVCSQVLQDPKAGVYDLARLQRVAPLAEVRTMEAFFHEDDDGAVEILPVEAWIHCEQQLGRIAEHAVKRRTPSGLNWTAPFLREGSPVSFADLGLTLAELDAALSPQLPSTDDVVMPLFQV